MKSSARLFVVGLFLQTAGCGSGGAPSSPSAVQATTATAVATPSPSVSPAPTRALSTNDVSVLFPLGKGELWAVSMSARNGEPLLPRGALDQVGRQVIREFQPGDATYVGLRVVSLRVDPCFSGTPCYPQIRLVLQGLTPDRTRAFDGSFHALYNLTVEDFAAMVAKLKTIALLAPENVNVTRLEVSPALLAQGMSGQYGLALRDLVTTFIGTSNLAKLTFMTRQQGGGTQWDFGGVNLRDFSPGGAFPIAGIDGNVVTQTVREVNQGGGNAGYAYTVTPSAFRGQLAQVLTSNAAQSTSASERQRAMDVLARAENPLLESPDTLDCGACHLANRIRGNLETTFGLSSSLSYTSSAEAARLIGGAERNNENLRAFGYFDAQPAISQRTANETLKVLVALR